MKRGVMLLVLLAWCSGTEAREYWAYVPDPPLLHVSVWEGRNVPVYVNNTKLLGGLGTGLNASLPRDVLPCEKPSDIREHSVPWERCYTNQAVAFPIQGTNSSIINWSVFNKTSWTQGLYEGLWSVAGGPIQLLLWKLAAALNTVTAVVTYPSSDKNKNWTASSWTVNVTACVPEPYALLVGKVNISHQGQTFNVTCVNCLLTNCIANVPWGEQVVVLHQPAFVMVPVNLSEP